MELYSKMSDSGWRLFYTNEQAMKDDVDNENFVAQAQDGQVQNFWGTIIIQIGAGADVQRVVARMLDLELEIGGELA